MNTTTTTTKLSAMTATLGLSFLLQAFSGLPLVFALAMVVGSVALLFGAAVVGAALIAPPRAPVTMFRARRLRATA